MSFSAPSRDRTAPTIPLASMIDVMFLLLIFFMTTYSMRDQELQLDVITPVSESPAQAPTRTQTVVTITKEGKLFVAGQQYDEAGLLAKLQEIQRSYPEESVVVRGSTSVEYGRVIRVIDIANEAGIKYVSQAVTRPDTTTSP